MQFNKKHHSNQTLINLYKGMLKPRMIEEKMLILLRQGQVSKWFSGMGQEAISVGVTQALQEDEYILPLHRNLGVWTNRNMPFQKLFSQWQGKLNGYSKGRERSFHFGTNEHHIVGMISHLGAMLGVADGIALAHKLFLIENNGYGLSTPSNEQFRCKNFIDKAIGYGIQGYKVDGNNILEVYEMVSNLASSMRINPRPVILECITFRMRGHEEASGTKYVPQELFEEWGKKDPISNYENWLKQEGILTDDMIAEFRVEFKQEIDAGVEAVQAEPDITPDTEIELADVFAPVVTQPSKPFQHLQHVTVAPQSETKTKKRLVDAISDGLKQSMERHDNLVLMGQDIAAYGGVFKITQGFVETFGKGRVRNTPLCESAIIGAAYGLSIKGMKAMVEMQFADFVSVGFNQIVNRFKNCVSCNTC